MEGLRCSGQLYRHREGVFNARQLIFNTSAVFQFSGVSGRSSLGLQRVAGPGILC